MNLLQSICCLFGNRCIPEEVKQTGGATRPSGPADLGQTEAELERAGKEQMGQMEGGEPSNNWDDQESRGRSPRTPRM